MRDTLPGLVMAQQQWVRWHLLNMGSTEDIHSVHFHGQTFSVRTSQEYHMGVYNLYPGEIQHEHCAQPSCVASCPCLLGCAKPVGDSENGEWVWKSQAGCLHSAWHHGTMLWLVTPLCSPFLPRCLWDSGDVALTRWDLAGGVQSGGAPASWDECPLPRVQPG